MAIRRYPALIFANTPMGEFLRYAKSFTYQTANKSATNGHHASDTLFGAQIVGYFLRTVRVHLDGLRILEPSQQPANNLYLAQDYLVTNATEKIVSIQSFKDTLLEKSLND